MVGRFLPGSLRHAGQLAFVGQLAQADAAQAELAVVGTRASAAVAAVVLARGILRLALCLGDHRFLSHAFPSFLCLRGRLRPLGANLIKVTPP